ncbi:MAG: DNA-directed RNA polymerase subunit beta' [bacterium]|nr:DNA-directed RNA polymerase subunit beta' [bacterium]
MTTDLTEFDGLRLILASPEDIKGWSHGEVTKAETINYRTLKPEKDGLFSESIFGPTKDWECYCGKYKRIRYRGVICDKCGVEVTQSKVRRERMGHLTLASPVVHAWFFRGAPTKLSLLLDMSPRQLESVIYFAQYLVTHVDEGVKKATHARLEDASEKRKDQLRRDVGETIKAEEERAKEEMEQIKKAEKARDDVHLRVDSVRLKMRQQVQLLRERLVVEQSRAEEIYKTVGQMVEDIDGQTFLSEEEYDKLHEYDAVDFFTVKMGGEAMNDVLSKINLTELSEQLREELAGASGARHIKLTKRLRLVEGMRHANISPTWMVLQILPILPPDLRPMVQLSGGRFATSDLNDLYRRVINRNNRLKRLMDLGAPEIILRNEKRMLQESVDALIDSSHRPNTRLTTRLRSLSDMLRGKQGRFLQNLLGKRVDYSGRSVIVVGPELKLHQAGLPKEMALEMFKPFVLRELISQGYAPNVKSAKHVLEHRSPEVWDILEEITAAHPILLNRAPTLHKLGFQAFYPVLIEGNAIRIHPCVCAGYNADFDGDQMAVHVPLSKLAQEETIERMLAVNNLLRPADGSPITIPNKEMALGCYYLTTIDDTVPVAKTIFGSFDEAIAASQIGIINRKQRIKVFSDEAKGMMETTVGRIIFNEVLPTGIDFINAPVKAETIRVLITQALRLCPHDDVILLIDGLKSLGFESATEAGLSVAVSDIRIYPKKAEIIAEADKRASDIERNLRRGLITKEEQGRLSNEIWIETTDRLAELTWANFEKDNAVRTIIDSGGTRATGDQIKQLAGMRGLVSDPTGHIVELPTKSNYREGLSVFEYFTSSRGARKGLADKALKTAEAGYLTRRLVDVAHDVIIRKDDCETKEGITIRPDDPRRRSFGDRALGRVVLSPVKDKKNGKVILPAGALVDDRTLQLLEDANIETIEVRTPLMCTLRYGMCAQCYGMDLSTKKLVEVGTPVGVVAAQSIGEPGTQLTMRTFHLGGIVGMDITQGLPRVEELFEVRVPKVSVPIADMQGRVDVSDVADGTQITIKPTTESTSGEKEDIRTYLLPPTLEVTMKTGDLVVPGQPLAAGHVDVKEILNVQGLRPAQQYIIDGAQEVYESQGVHINDRHFEVIVRKMCDKVRIEKVGDTTMLPGELVDRYRFEQENERASTTGGKKAIAKLTILGITRASLFTESFLSAASFQETSNVLTDSSVTGRVDRLLGLKENVIIGRLIPTDPERAVIEEAILNLGQEGYFQPESGDA